MIHLNFDTTNCAINSEFDIFGSVPVMVDQLTQKNSCYFDGNSFLRLKSIAIGSSDFSIQTIFRPETIGQECGIFGSYGYRLSLRQDPRTNSVSFWIDFPSSTNMQRVQFFVDPNTWAFCEHYFGVQKVGDTFFVQLDQETKTFEVSKNFGALIPFLGTYYDKMYGFRGYIRQYRLDFTDKGIHTVGKYTLDSIF